MKYIQSACALGRDKFALLCLDDRLQHEDESPNQIVFRDGRDAPSTSIDREGENVRLCRVSLRDDSVAVLSRDGALEILSFSGLSLGVEDVTGSISRGEGLPRYGFMMSLGLIGDRLYACGMGGQVYLRSAPNDWRLISQEICTTKRQKNWFSNVQGLDVSHIFADGLTDLYFYDGAKWHRIDTGTDAAVGEIAFIRPDEMYVSGERSTLLRGSPQAGLKALNLVERSLTIYTICLFQERLFLGTERGVFEFDRTSSRLSGVTVNVDDNAFDVVSLQSIDNVMWCFGNKAVYRFDGNQWEQYHNIF